MNRLRSLFVLAGLFACAKPSLLAQGTLTTLFTNGPNANRINLVVLSEGYQTNQLAQFLVNATNAVNSLLAAPPYSEYRSYFNAFAISVASTQSGSDHYTPATNLVDTYFNSSFDSYGLQRLLTIPPNDRDGNYNHGVGKVVALLQTLLPDYDLAILLVNDTQYGGSGGSPLITSLNSASSEIVVHESGHSFADLTDEYTSAYPGFTPTEKPNATTQTNRASIKWTTWIGSNTPLPTPQTSQYAAAVGLFEGAEYQTTGWYRPKLDCKMNHLGIPFCEVCSEQIVKSTYQQVRSISAFTPASTNFLVTNAQAVSFSLTPLQPANHSLSVQWFTNNVAVTGATNGSFTLLPPFNNGTNFVRAQVRDNTTLVRNDPVNLLSNSVTWTVRVSIPSLRLVAPQWGPGGQVAFSITGAAPNGFLIQASTDLVNYSSISTNVLTGGQYRFTNNTASFARRFYRAMAL